MTQPEYIAALLSIIVGLGLTDLAKSLRELVRPHRRVDWHWLPLLWAATTFLLAVQIWWNSFSFLTGATAAFFIVYLLTFLLLYLACAFALPDPKWEKSRVAKNVGGSPAETPGTREGPGAQTALDLRAFYFSETHRRWFFGVFIAFIVMGQIGSQTARALSEGFSPRGQEMLLNGVSVMFIGTLILTDRWWVHVPISVLYFLGVGWGTASSIFGF
ncbi:hypothetical protein [Salinibacter sp.]|uniref:hypothetical protein n=1 Tax=Salinibacter sp. TaxID=2065818 RepID=UPI0021E7E304|nr:hypothetical protein [Salinibacter sp.]